MTDTAAMPNNDQKARRNLRVRVAALICFFVAFNCCGVTRAQDGANKKSDATSDLGRLNLNQVAASALQIKAILIEDPGLLVTLKDWIAQDATDHGQVLSEDDLTDGAIYDRLESDVQFRAVATRLVQQYGFLVPQVNPESTMGQQQLLVMQQVAKLTAQQEQQSVEQQHVTSAPAPAQANNPCAQASSFCASPVSLPVGGVQSSPSIQSAPQNPNPGQSAPAAGGSLERAQYTQGGANLSNLGMPTGSTSSSSGLNSSLALSPTLDPSADRDSSLSSLFASYGAPGGTGGIDTIAPAHPAGTPVAAGQEYQQAGQAVSSSAPGLVRAADPYTDIPSLYDMYLQANPRPSTPTRFGVDIFQNGIRDPQSIPMDLPVGPDYVVGPGDGLAIDLWGGVSQHFYSTVDREGRISLPEVGPVLVSGKSLADVQADIQKNLRTQFRDISVDVSLSRLRTIRVYEVGDVAKPGAYDISSLSTPLNALFAAGGPTAQGSMRIVKHYRGDQLVEEVDLYDLLLNGVKSGMARLENGDTILVPPLGPEVTVEGMVRRPAIYELKNEKTLADVLELAGGMLPSAALRHIEVQRLVAHDKQTMLSLDIPQTDGNADITQKLESFQIQDGDRIRIYPIAPYNQDAVYLEGHVLSPGRYSYTKNMRVGQLIGSYKDLLPEPATQYAEIIRLNAPDFHPTVESFDLGAALDSPSTSPVLQPLDTVRIFGKYDFENAPTVSVWGDVRAPGTYQTSGQMHLVYCNS